VEKGPTEVDCSSLSYMAVGRLSVVELTFFFLSVHVHSRSCVP
jgi:hypothetical protein